MATRALRAPAMTRGWLGATLGVVTLVVLVPLTIFLVASWLLGWQLVSVQTGSMSPTFGVGSLVVLGPVDPADVQVGMAIAFQDPADGSRLVTHRVVGLAPGSELAFITKGDANAAQDPFVVPAERVMGRPLWSITLLGRVFEWLAWPRSLILVLAPGILLALDGFRGRRPRPEPQPAAA